MSNWEKVVVPAKDGVASYPNGYRLSLPDGAVRVYVSVAMHPGLGERHHYVSARRQLEGKLEENSLLRLTAFKERRFTSTHHGAEQFVCPVEVLEISCYAVPEVDCPFAGPKENE